MDASLDKLEILRSLAVAGSQKQDLAAVVRASLAQASRLVGLAAATLILWDERMTHQLVVTHAEVPESEKLLKGLEEDLFRKLREQRRMVSAYMVFGGEHPYQSFTLPLQQGEHIFGAVIGLQHGRQNLINENLFLEALSALLSLAYAVSEMYPKPPQAAADENMQAKLAGIMETALTVNHEINSPLTAILGNVQLLLRDQDRLDKAAVTKLKTIEQSAERIRRVTKMLLEVKQPRSVEYSDGIRMLDLSPEKPEQE